MHANSNGVAANSRSNLWESLRTKLDVAKWKPARADGIIVSELADRAGAYFVLKNPSTHTYHRLSLREYWVWQQLDGKSTVQELIVAYFHEYKSFAFALVVGLVQQLFEKQMLREQPEFVLTNLHQELEHRTLFHKLFNPEHGILTRQFVIRHFDERITRLYRAGAWILFRRLVLILFATVAFAGSVLYLKILSDPKTYPFIERGTGITLTVVVLYILAIIPIVLHELAHALATKHYKREVYQGGLLLYYGLPAAYVDITDIWLEGKWHRVAAGLAGPFTSILVAGICTIWLIGAAGEEYAPLLFQIATIGFVTSLVNLNPALKLDGYYVLSDALEISNLRERSFAFFRFKFLPRLFQRTEWTRDEYFFLAYAALTVAWTGYAAFLAWLAYHTRIAPSIESISARVAQEIRVGSIVLLALLALTVIIVLRQKLFAMARRASLQIRRIEQMTRPTPLALAIVLAALLITFVPLVLIREFTELADTLVGVMGIALALYGAVKIAREMRGTYLARAWQLIALAIGLVGIAHVLWGVRFAQYDLTDSIAIALDLSALGLACIAAFISFPALVGLRGSWRAPTTLLLGLGWLSLLTVPLHGPILFGVTLHLFPVLLLLGGVVHWQMAHPPPLTQRTAQHAGTINEQMQNAFIALTESMFAQLRASFGQGNALRVQARFNLRSRERDWGIQFADEKAKLATAQEQNSAADTADLCAAVLSSLLYSTAHAVGESFARTAFARAYDALPWDEREVIAENVLPQTRYAEGLAEQFAQARQDSAVLLERAPLFADFTREELSAIARELRIEHFPRGDIIIHQGDTGDKFYIIRRGRVQVTQRNAQGFERVVNHLESGDYFGEAALLTGAPRNATIRAVTSISTFTLSKRPFDQLVRAGFRGRDKMDAVAQRAALLRRIPIFSDFDNLELRRVVGQLESSVVPAGQTIIQQGEQGDKFYIIESGEVSVQVHTPQGESVEQVRLSDGEFFGEIALLMNVPRIATVIAVKPTRLLALGADAFNELVRQSQGVNRALERTGSRRILLVAHDQNLSSFQQSDTIHVS